MVDYYKVLGVSRDATNNDIKAAFRRLALKFHPDRHASASKSEQRVASDQFKQAKEAYEVLGDEKQRAYYNRTGGAPSWYGNSSASSSSSYGPSSTYTGYTGYQSKNTSYEGARTDWQRSTYHNHTNYSGARRRATPEYTYKWEWKVNTSAGPSLMFRVAAFGVAFCTIIFLDSLSSVAWHRQNSGASSSSDHPSGSRSSGFFETKSYEEMLERLEYEKKVRAQAGAEKSDEGK